MRIKVGRPIKGKKIFIGFKCERHTFGAWELLNQTDPVRYCKACHYIQRRPEYFEALKEKQIRFKLNEVKMSHIELWWT